MIQERGGKLSKTMEKVFSSNEGAPEKSCPSKVLDDTPAGKAAEKALLLAWAVEMGFEAQLSRGQPISSAAWPSWKETLGVRLVGV